MQPSSQTASNSLPTFTCVFTQSQRRDDFAYEAITIAAILVLLYSLWVF